jgi:hypothetical protein
MGRLYHRSEAIPEDDGIPGRSMHVSVARGIAVNVYAQQVGSPVPGPLEPAM